VYFLAGRWHANQVIEDYILKCDSSVNNQKKYLVIMVKQIVFRRVYMVRMKLKLGLRLVCRVLIVDELGLMD